MSNAASSGIAVDIRGLGFAYSGGPPVLRDCSLQVRQGRILAVLGPNGRGKTTLLELIAGALRPSKGTLAITGRVAYLPQVVRIGFAYRVLDVVLMGRAAQIGLFSVPGAADERKARQALERMGIAALAERPFTEISGGERQLVMFARALATEAATLVLDEPTAALDLKNQQVALRHIRRLAGDDGLTVIFSTHHPQHAEAIADEVALLYSADRRLLGSTSDVMTEANLSELFGVAVRRVEGWAAR